MSSGKPVDWQKLKTYLDESAISFTIQGGTLDEVSQSLISFIPTNPNQKADAKWLERRGWVKSNIPRILVHPNYGICFEVTAEKSRIQIMSTSTSWQNPTRMTVALCEAMIAESRKLPSEEKAAPPTLTEKRWKELVYSDTAELTPEEKAAGYHWCVEYDGDVFVRGTREGCTCPVPPDEGGGSVPLDVEVPTDVEVSTKEVEVPLVGRVPRVEVDPDVQTC